LPARVGPRGRGRGAAALLADRTGEKKYWSWYDRIWTYSWRYFVDHEYGAWYRILAPDNAKRLIVSLQPIGAGSYKVDWKVTSVDTHETHGSFGFKVGS
jgi:hypothetical protein